MPNCAGAIVVELGTQERVSGLLAESTLERRPEAQGNAPSITAELRHGKHWLEGRRVSGQHAVRFPGGGREGAILYSPGEGVGGG